MKINHNSKLLMFLCQVVVLCISAFAKAATAQTPPVVYGGHYHIPATQESIARTKQFNELHELIRTAESENDYKSIIEYANRALTIYEHDLGTVNYLVYAYRKLKQPENALAAYRNQYNQVREGSVHPITTHSSMQMVLLLLEKRNDWPEAVKIFNTVTREGPTETIACIPKNEREFRADTYERARMEPIVHFIIAHTGDIPSLTREEQLYHLKTAVEMRPRFAFLRLEYALRLYMDYKYAEAYEQAKIAMQYADKVLQQKIRTDHSGLLVPPMPEKYIKKP